MDDIILKFLEQFVRKFGAIVCLLLTLIALLAVPLKIMSYGYRPPDDAKRHSAHALDTRTWDEIVVQNSGAVADTNPGWDTLLRLLHKQFNWDQEELLIFSVVGLASLYLLTGLFLVQDSMAWAIGLLVGLLTSSSLITRITIGRPFIITICCMMGVMMIWRKSRIAFVWRLIVTLVLFALSCWFHGSWYLAVLIPVSFVLTGQFTSGVLIGLCWLGGSFLGGLLTGYPFAFLYQEFSHAFLALGEQLVQRQLVGEFRADVINLFFLLGIALTIVIQMSFNKKSLRLLVKDPLFVLYVLGTVLGLSVHRFNVDWGMPAGVLWLACQWKDILKISQLREHNPLFHLGILSVLLVTLFFSATNDIGERWSKYAEDNGFDVNDPEIAEWLPARDGIVYSNAMTVFYNMYFDHPTALWRYILGYESGIMPKDDLEIFRNIQWNHSVPVSFEPWVNKMHKGDRLVVQSSSKPLIQGLEWHLVANNLWFGRKPVNVSSDE